MRPSGLVLLLLSVAGSGCLDPEPADVPPLLEPFAPDPSLTLVSGESRVDADGLHATLRTAGPLRQDWEGSYAVEFSWLGQRDGPGPLDHVRYSGYGSWDTDRRAWSFGWWAEERLCGCDDQPVPVQVEGTGVADGDTMTWTMAYSNASHAGLPFTVRFVSHLMSEGGCDYDEWPWGDQERTQGCAARRPVAKPLRGTVGDAWEAPGQVGPVAVRWAIDRDQAAVDFHYPGPALDALKRHTLHARLIVPGPDGWTTDLSVTDADSPYWPGDARIEAANPPPGGAGSWDRLDSRGSRIDGEVLHAQWILATPGPRPDPGTVRLAFAVVDQGQVCTVRWVGAAADHWDLPPYCPPLQ